MKKTIKLILKILILVILVFILGIVGFVSYNLFYKTYSYKSAIRNSDKVYVIMDGNKTEVTDINDAQNLKDVFDTLSYGIFGETSCGFWEDYAVEFVDSEDNYSLLVCPAADTCNVVKIQEFCHEISRKDREKFNDIVTKYGMKVPNI